MSKYLGIPKRTYQYNEAKNSIKLSPGILFKISQLHHIYILYYIGVYDELALSSEIKNDIKKIFFGVEK